jgi:predicted exporter
MSGRRAWWGWVLLLGVIALGLARVRFDGEVLNLLPGDLPEVRGLRLHQRHFADAGDLLLTVRAPTADAARQAARALAERLAADPRRVRRVVWQPPGREHSAATARLLAWLWLNQPPDAVRALAARLDPETLPDRLAATLDTLATTLSPLEIARLSRDPLGLTRLPAAAGLLDPTRAGGEWFASPDGRFRVLHVEPVTRPADYRACAAWLAGVRDEVGRAAQAPDWPAGVRVAWTGAPAFLVEAASGMERDLRRATLGALVLIAALFWGAHRRWRPLVGVVTALLGVLLGVTALGGLIFRELNAVSLGFAAILLGLGVDYALVFYQEWAADPRRSVAAARRAVGPAVGWAALTTAAAFGLLNFAGLPGLRQLGTLVALGVLLAAAVMAWGFLPWAARATPARSGFRFRLSDFRPRRGATMALTAGFLLLAVAILLRRPPALDASTRPLSPAHSAAQAALDELQQRLGQSPDTLWLLVSGADEQAVAERLAAWERTLRRAAGAGEIAGFELPTALWPRPDWQRENRARLERILARAPALRRAVREAGFSEEGWALAAAVFAAWRSWVAGDGVVWPDDPTGRWLTGRFAARGDSGWLALGRVDPAGGPLAAARALRAELADPGVLLTGWSLLGRALLQRVEGRVFWLTLGVAGALLLCLGAAFRNVRDVLLVLAAGGVAVLGLLAVMSLAGWRWNLLNLAALPLLLGVGVDYAIHVTMALRRHDGNMAALWRTTGRALLLCGATTIAGFGSLAWSGNAGLASLGRVCAVGVACALLSALYFLPRWRYAGMPAGAAARSLSDRRP